ncbi:MAG: rhomboid family intramembrane serine protease [Treponema sp.]|nr:rhomboid family intramembrane serine protease [Treponema sp.]
MAKKKFKLNFKVVMDCPVTVGFVLVSLILCLLDLLAFKGSLSQSILRSPTSAKGDLAFILSSPLSYFRLVLYAFGAANWTALLANLLFLLLLGPAMEERYGSVVIGIMVFVASLFSGVLNAAFSTVSLRGCAPVVFMMVFLNAFMSLSKKKIPLSFLLIFALLISYEIIDKTSGNVIGIIICIAGGLCGSLFAFLTSPKARAAKKAESDKGSGLLSKAEKAAYLEELDSQSPRNKKPAGRNSKKNDDDDDDTTVVGTLKF